MEMKYASYAAESILLTEHIQICFVKRRYCEDAEGSFADEHNIELEN